jgi:glucokinase
MMTDDRALLTLADAMRPLYAGVDLGGTNIKAALVDDAGRLVAFHTEPTHVSRGPEDAAARMGRSVHTLASRAGIATSDIARATRHSHGHDRAGG